MLLDDFPDLADLDQILITHAETNVNLLFYM
jgi:hypothetical protein